MEEAAEMAGLLILIVIQEGVAGDGEKAEEIHRGQRFERRACWLVVARS